MPAKVEYSHRFWSRAGRPSKREKLSRYEARRRAQAVVRDGKGSGSLFALIETLSVACVLTADQIEQVMDIKPRTVQGYQQKHYVDRIQLDDPRIQTLFPQSDRRGLRVYCLGQVGKEIAKLLEGGDTRTISSVAKSRVLHDLCVNHVVLTLGTLAAAEGWDTSWVGRREAIVRAQDNFPVLEPDALIKMTRPASNGDIEHRNFVVEYMAENSGVRAAGKVIRYDDIYRSGHWMESWGLRAMPPVLVVFMHKAVGKAFYGYFQTNRSVTTTRFYGKAWNDLCHPDNDEPVGKWYLLNRLDFETLFEEQGPILPRPGSGDQPGSGPDSANQMPPAANGW